MTSLTSDGLTLGWAVSPATHSPLIKLRLDMAYLRLFQTVFGWVAATVRPRAARFSMSARTPKTHGGAAFDRVTRLASAPSFDEAMVTTSPVLWVNPPPPPSRSLVGANMVPRNSTKPSGY